MAEVIGVVSGAVTFATVVVQLGKSIAILKNCWDQLNDAPHDLRRLTQEIELFGLIVADIEEDLSQESGLIARDNSKCVLQCLTLCKEAAEDLESICTDIVRDTKPVNYLRWAVKSTKLVMRKGKIEKHVARLQNVIQLLMLSQQCYMRALIRVQPKFIMETVRRPRSICSESSTSITDVTNENRCKSPKAQNALQRKSPYVAKDRSYRWRLSLPHWMTSKVIEVAGMRAPSGWNWMLRAYSVIPFRSQAVGCVMTGNLQLLQDLFASGQASPFDQIEDTGLSLLYWVGRLNRAEIIEFLLNQGANPSSSDYIPIHSRVISRGPRVEDHEMPSLIPSMRVLLEHIDVIYETAEDAVEYALSGFYGTPEEFSFLQQHLCPSFYQLPELERIELALRVTNNYTPHHFVPELIRNIIGMDVLQADDINGNGCLGFARLKLIHSAARKLGTSQRYLQTSECVEDMQLTCESWGDLCRELIRLNIDVHSMIDGNTLFLAFIQGYFSQSTLSSFQNGNVACNSAIHVWLSNLEAAGIDLVRYGEKEQYIWKNRTIRQEFGGWNIAEQVTDMQRVIGFVYGHFPEDWNIWIAEASDAFVGQFWDIIEWPVEVMPGAWPEE